MRTIHELRKLGVEANDKVKPVSGIAGCTRVTCELRARFASSGHSESACAVCSHSPIDLGKRLREIRAQLIAVKHKDALSHKNG